MYFLHDTHMIFHHEVMGLLNNLNNIIDIDQQSPAANSFVIVF